MSIRGITLLFTLTTATALAHVSVASALSPLGSFGGGGAVAVDPITGYVYEAQANENRIVKYDQSGNFILTFGKDVNETTGGNICPEKPSDTCKTGVAGLGAGELDVPRGVAVDPTTQDVYVNAGAGGFGHEAENHRVERFSTNGQYRSQIIGGQNGAPEFQFRIFASGVAVDAEGNLYVVSDRFGGPVGVLKFDPAGEYTGQEFLAEEGAPPVNVAVDKKGLVYVSRDQGPVIKFAPNGTVLGELSCRRREYTLGGLTVNPFNDEVFIAGSEFFTRYEEAEPYVCRYDASGKLLEEFKATESGQRLDEMAYGAAAGILYEAFSERSPAVWMYGTFPTPPPGAPSVSREDWSNPGVTSMTVSGRVNPHSLDTHYFFQYSTSPDLSGAPNVPASPGDAGSSFLPMSESVSLTGLSHSTTYYYRMVAYNEFAGGTTVEGPIQPFTTLAPLPSAATEAASELSNDAATVGGTVLPGSTGPASDTLWCFQYGTADTPAGVYDLGFAPGAPAGDAGQGTEGVPVSVRLTRLQPETTYRYRLVAVNSLGSRLSSTACGSEGGHETDGSEGTFTTTATGPGPLATSGPLTALSQSSASLTGSVDPRGTSTVYDFQLGTDQTYGVDLFGPAGAGGESEPVSVVVSSLQPGTTYHYRLVASSRFGTSYGADMSFTTPGVPSSMLVAPLAPPLVASAPFVFPAEAVVTTPRTVKCKRGYKRDGRGRCVKVKPRKKKVTGPRRRRGKGARHRGK